MSTDLNWFMAAGTLLMFGASGEAFYTSNWKTGVVYICFGVANAMMSLVKG